MDIGEGDFLENIFCGPYDPFTVGGLYQVELVVPAGEVSPGRVRCGRCGFDTDSHFGLLFKGIQNPAGFPLSYWTSCAFRPVFKPRQSSILKDIMKPVGLGHLVCDPPQYEVVK